MAQRFAEGAQLEFVDGTTERKLFPGFAATAEASVAFDGDKLVSAANNATPRTRRLVLGTNAVELSRDSEADYVAILIRLEG